MFGLRNLREEEEENRITFNMLLMAVMFLKCWFRFPFSSGWFAMRKSGVSPGDQLHPFVMDEIAKKRFKIILQKDFPFYLGPVHSMALEPVQCHCHFQRIHALETKWQTTKPEVRDP